MGVGGGRGGGGGRGEGVGGGRWFVCPHSLVLKSLKINKTQTAADGGMQGGIFCVCDGKQQNFVVTNFFGGQEIGQRRKRKKNARII